MKKERVMTIATIGIDLGKNSCSLAGLDDKGAVVLRRRLSRDRLVAFLSGQPTCVVAMEACCGAHRLRRAFAAQGHQVRLTSPEYVQPYVKAQSEADKRTLHRGPLKKATLGGTWWGRRAFRSWRPSLCRGRHEGCAGVP